MIAVVQPHRYSRLGNLMEEFQTAFNDADLVLVTPVYAAGEAPVEGVDADALVEGLKRRGHRQAATVADADALAGELAATIAARATGGLPGRGRHHQMGRRARRRDARGAGEGGVSDWFKASLDAQQRMLDAQGQALQDGPAGGRRGQGHRRGAGSVGEGGGSERRRRGRRGCDCGAPVPW